jgi:glycine cleavage system H protein
VTVADLSGYRFAATHEWVRLEDGHATVGITDHAQSQLGDVIFLELPAVGDSLAAGEKFGVIESVKAASDLYAPVSGTVAAVNNAVVEKPELVNTDPYGDGWMLRVDGATEGGVELVDDPAYRRLVGE